MMSTSRLRWGLGIVCVFGAGAVMLVADKAGKSTSSDTDASRMVVTSARASDSAASTSVESAATGAARGEVSGSDSASNSALHPNDGSILGTNLTGPSDWSPEGRDVITVSPRVQLRLEITATDPADYIRNIRVIMPGGGAPEEPYSWWIDAKDCPHGSFKTFEQTCAKQVFHPAFLASIKNYRALRFMDWMGTNGSSQQEFEGRPDLADARWRGRGIPLEIMCSLANLLHADPWFNVPHLADDDYVSQMAELIRRCLAPGLTPHIEYSNEVWNTAFPQYKYAEAQGLQLGLTTNAFGAALQFYSQRSVQVFNVFEQVYSGHTTLVRVMAAQAASSWTSEQVLKFNKAFEHTDALAIAPYFGRAVGPDDQGAVQAMSIDQLFDYMRNDPGGLAMSISWMKQQAAVAKKFGVRLVAYEGGQHLVGYQGVENNNTINALFDAFNRDPRIGALYADYLTAWKQAGGGLFMHFVNTSNFGKWGRWGAEEYLGQPLDQAPKFAALQQFIEANR
ncbi:MAG: hypothetical protein HZB26_21825 [Candidatus Hydrogenedentes bacterium]|nr:hypothetical protein [Candidatus Hydrogenedentota bacterium]